MPFPGTPWCSRLGEGRPSYSPSFSSQQKVNSDLLIEVKPSNRIQKLLEEKIRKRKQLTKKRLEEMRRWHAEMRWQGPCGTTPCAPVPNAL